MFTNPKWYLLLLVFFVISQARAGNCILGIGTHYGQDWYGRDCTNWTREIQGTIVATVVNTGSSSCPAADEDWNIKLQPDPGYLWVLKNDDGDVNTNEPGLFCGITLPNWFSDAIPIIELEVKTTRPAGGGNLATFFPSGSHVIASGDWVEDSGHSNKTELHPLLSLRTEDPLFWNVLIAQDASYRFISSYYSLADDIPLEVPTTGATIALSTLGPMTENQDSGSILREQFFLDQFDKVTNVTTANRSTASVVSLDPGGTADVSVSLSPRVPGLRPLYLGTFAKFFERAVTEETGTYTVNTITTQDAAGAPQRSKYVKATVTLTVKAPPADMASSSSATIPIAYSTWAYDVSAAGGRKTIWEDKLDGPHKITMHMLYSPEEGHPETQWTMRVSASTTPRDWTPDAPPTNGLNGPFTRYLLHDQRTYYIVPSRLSVDVSPREAVITLPTDSLARQCNIGYQVKLKEKLVRGVSLRKLGWEVVPVSSPTGSASSSAPIKIATTGPSAGRVSVGDATIEVDPGDTRTVAVTFKDEGWTAAPTTNTWNPTNKTKLRLVAVGQTELGENPSASTEELGMGPCHKLLPPAYKGPYADLGKILAVAVWLHEHGHLQSHVPLISDLGSPRTIGLLPQFIPMLGDDEHTERRLIGMAKEATQIYRTMEAMKQGKKLTGAQEALVKSAQKIAIKLPAYEIPIAAKSVKFNYSSTHHVITAPSAPWVAAGVNQPFHIAISNGLFNRGSKVLLGKSKYYLGEIAVRLRRNPRETVAVEVATDESPSAQINLMLAQRRAEAARAFLIHSGVKGTQIKVSGTELKPTSGRSTESMMMIDVK